MLRKTVPLAAVAVSLAGCAKGYPPVESVAAGQNAYEVMGSAAQVEAAAPYRIGPDDTISINTFFEPELSVESVKVDRSGQIGVLGIGSMTVEGMTTEQLAAQIEDSYRGRLLERPEVSVSVVNSAERKVVVTGQVNISGVYDIRNSTTLLEASVHHNFHLDNKAGFSTLLISPVLVPETLKPTDVDNLSVIPSGPIPPSPPRLLSADTLDRVFNQLRERFDVIVIDAPPVLGLADAPQLASAAGGVLYVVEAHAGSQGQAKASIRRLLSAGTNILSVVLTKYDFRQGNYSSYGYHDSYSYGGQDRAEA
ncbi:polysaccharide biosynthesis/export family protein [Croceicoccus marinus]|uniref:Polysaccharide biosynthesis/export family protein n=1 Tax=Croceicoccus marinus TaxID=450378 RepID=A0A7G6VUY1_9SPHN|nr:polysaccharide biosynthesis/export family protein [Croceicoccus marinus]QNE05546.1 polysaccharide biosynthesis/export family protein [Croceicoccus marinus]